MTPPTPSSVAIPVQKPVKIPGQSPVQAPGQNWVPQVRNLFADLPTLSSGEFFEELAACRGVRIERILSSAQPEPVLYDQEQDEWVCLLQGEARLWIAGEDRDLRAGDVCLIPAHTPHRLVRTSGTPPCLWLAVHIHPHAPEF